MEKIIEKIQKEESLLFDEMVETARESGSTVATNGVIIEGRRL